MSSYAHIPSKVVIQACATFLQQRNDRIAAQREKLIEELMQPRRGWFKTKPGMSRDAAIDYLERGDWDSDWNRIAWQGGAWARDAEDLLQLAQQSEHVKVHREDAWILDYAPQVQQAA